MCVCVCARTWSCWRQVAATVSFMWSKANDSRWKCGGFKAETTAHGIQSWPSASKGETHMGHKDGKRERERVLIYIQWAKCVLNIFLRALWVSSVVLSFKTTIRNLIKLLHYVDRIYVVDINRRALCCLGGETLQKKKNTKTHSFLFPHEFPFERKSSCYKWRCVRLDFVTRTRK